MPGSTTRPRRSRLKWIVPALVAALSAAILFVGSVAANLVATDVDQSLRPYRVWVWVVFIGAFIIAVVIAVKQVSKPNELTDAPVEADAQDDTNSRSKPNSGTRPTIVIGKDEGEAVFFRIPPTANALHQLPPPPRDFTGRVRELDELMSRIERGGVNISGLQGLGGVGKTALALKLAELLAPRYTDAQFYLDLRGADKQKPLSVADALSHVIRAYHPTAKLPEGEAELRALYLSVLHDQRALLLMDNAAGLEQVAPLIPPDTCVLLVTSRRHFTLPGIFALDLETLPPEDARQLLLKIAPRIKTHADEIAQLCGRLPLALRLAASALAERANLSPADYVRRLSDAKTRLGLVEASLTLSYELLTPEMQRLWRALAVFPDTFDTAAAAFVWKVEADTAQDTLGDLLKSSLLEWDDDTARHRLHDLARIFANSRLSEEERSASRMGHAEHYLSVLWETDKLYKQGGDAIKHGLALFDLEWRNIQTGQAWAESQSGENDVAAALCSDYPSAGVYLLTLRQHPREQISWLEAALVAARRLNDRIAEGRHLGNLGLAYADLGEMRSVIELYEQALVIAREIGDRHGEGSVLGNLGLAYADLGETRRAIEFYEQHLAIAREIGDRSGEGNALGNVSLALDELGDRGKAIANAEAALEIFEQIESPYAAKVRAILTEWRGEA